MLNMKMIRTEYITIEGNEIPCYVYEFQKGDRVRLPKCKKVVSLKKGKHKKELLKLYAGFDIETTNIIEANSKLAFMYIWQFIIANDENGFIYLGRTWEDFIYLLENIATFYNTSETTRLIIWDANFSFEFQFLRHHIEWNTGEYDFFAKEVRKPLLATCYGGIEWRDCLAISGGSLEMLANDFCTTKKLKGDLDYAVLRNSNTPLTREELNYCVNDVKILAEFSNFAFNEWIIKNKRVPLTKTGILRNEVKTELKKTCKDLEIYKHMILACYPDKETYIKWFNYLFRGGFVHGNFYHMNEILSNVLMYDITSSYPAQALLRYYPVTPFCEDHYAPEKLETMCCIMEVEFWNIETTTYHSIESKHKLLAFDGVKLDNGRVYKADYIKVLLTELDFDNYRKFYRWSDINIISFKTARRGNLPKFLVDVMKRYYIKKAELKKSGQNHTPKYNLAKSAVNSFFGMCVTRINLDKVQYGGEWEIIEHGINFKEETEKQILLPQWGIYISAHGRHELLSTVWEIEKVVPNTVIYCDTDSIKCVYDAQIQTVIDAYNKNIASELKRHKLTNEAFNDLGMFDLEYGKPVDKFKGLGAKRYIYEVNGEFNCTIAGLPKNVLGKISDDPFTTFDIDGMSIPLDLSEKLTTAYNDEPTTAVIEGEEMHELSSVALYAIPFSMFTDEMYYTMLLNGKDKRRYVNNEHS